MQFYPLKRRHNATRLHGVKSQKTATLSFVCCSTVRLIYGYLPQIVWMTNKKKRSDIWYTTADSSIRAVRTCKIYTTITMQSDSPLPAPSTYFLSPKKYLLPILTSQTAKTVTLKRQEVWQWTFYTQIVLSGAASGVLTAAERLRD
jgi:hypothetical protein